MDPVERPKRPRVRLFVEVPLAGGMSIAAQPTQAHYLMRVMRLGAGDSVALFNGVDGEWLARLEPTGRRGCGLLVAERLRPQIVEPGPWLLVAPVKRSPLDLIARAATELGAEALCPVITHRTAVDRVNVDRLSAITREAAEQCGRLTVPRVEAPSPLETVLDTWPASRRLYWADESGAGIPALDQFASANADDEGAILIGPEGGFDLREQEALAALPFATAVSLGPRILRAETAALSVLTLWQAAVGDKRHENVS